MDVFHPQTGSRIFMTNHRLLAKLSQRIWKVLSVYLKAGVSYDNRVPGSVIVIQAFGDF